MTELGLYRKIRFQVTIALVCTLLAYVGFNKGWDPLAEKYLGSTGYLYTHFLMYTMMGYINFFGGRRPYEYALGLSTVWEFTEFLIGVSSGTVKYWTSGGINGQLKDITVNMTGFFVGRQLRDVSPCQIQECSRKLLGAYEMSSVALVVLALVKFKVEEKKNVASDQ